MGAVLKANGDSFVLGPANGREFTLKEVQAVVGGYIEAVSIPRSTRTMWVNEEGLLKGLPLNEEASQLAKQRIVGDVLVSKESETESQPD